MTGCRKAELVSFYKFKLMDGLFLTIILSIPSAIAVFSLWSYQAAGNTLTADVVFPAIALFNIIRGPLMEIPFLISGILQVRRLSLALALAVTLYLSLSLPLCLHSTHTSTSTSLPLSLSPSLSLPLCLCLCLS